MNVGQERFKMLKVIQEKPYMIALVGLDVIDEEPEEGPGQQAIIAAEQQVWQALQDVVMLSNKVHNKTKVTVSDQVAKYAPGAETDGGMSERARRSNFSFAVTEMLDVPGAYCTDDDIVYFTKSMSSLALTVYKATLPSLPLSISDR